jgi:hypothetical protein
MRVPVGTDDVAMLGNLDVAGTMEWGGGAAIASSTNVANVAAANTWAARQTFGAQIRVGSTGAVLTDILEGTVNMTGTSALAHGEFDSDNATVTGAAVGDVVIVQASGNTNVVMRGQVAAANTVAVRRYCVDAVGAGVGAETLRLFVIKRTAA